MLGHELRNPLAPILTAVQLMRLRGGPSTEQGTGGDRAPGEAPDPAGRRSPGRLARDRRQNRADQGARRAGGDRGPGDRDGEPARSSGTSTSWSIDVACDRSRRRRRPVAAGAGDREPDHQRGEVHAARAGGSRCRRGGTAREVEFTVADTGIGIAPDMLPRVFDMFVQDRQALARSQGGLGLGLTIVRSIMALHGGTVTARSDGAGRGAVFTVRMPAAEGELGAPRRRRSDRWRRGEAAGPPRRTGRRVLVVDDNEDAATTLAGALRTLGHAVHVAHDGPSALDRRRSPLDLALLDIGLPVMDGYELARHLRRRVAVRSRSSRSRDTVRIATSVSRRRRASTRIWSSR